MPQVQPQKKRKKEARWSACGALARWGSGPQRQLSTSLVRPRGPRLRPSNAASKGRPDAMALGSNGQEVGPVGGGLAQRRVAMGKREWTGEAGGS